MRSSIDLAKLSADQAGQILESMISDMGFSVGELVEKFNLSADFVYGCLDSFKESLG